MGVVIRFTVDVRLVDALAEVTQEEGHTGFIHLRSAVLALIFLARRIQPPLSPSSTLKSNFVYPRNIRSPLVGHDVRKNPGSCDCAEIRTHVPKSEASRLPTEPPGRPV